MAEESRLDVLGLQELAQNRILLEINLADGKVVRGAPMGIEPVDMLGGKRTEARS